MSIFDRLTGTRRPEKGAAPRPVADVRGALLGLVGDQVPFQVREAMPGEKADLVAECQVPRVRITLRTRMRFVPDVCEVRFLDERWERRSGDGASVRYGRGYAPAVYWEGKEFRFSTRQTTDPLRDAVLGAGWTWRGVLRFR
ncbi:hypothetical protein [Streptomyces sp. WAC 04229]|uniref:hypothetical protein n=1 Tax=Streptomyces sp. WAC 04229 TaxID=2203206 RepID=UPI00163B826D|nr:hypothetical protein [Streptomyces sp. WAC 04229]